MSPDKGGLRLTLRHALGAKHPPLGIAQEAFEHDYKHLYRLLHLGLDEQPRGDDLFAYMEDLNYTEIQSSLFVHLLPICLEMWRNDLLGIDRNYGGVVEQFYPVLANRRVFEDHLTPKQTQVVSEFMRRAILEEIDEQRGLEYRRARTRPYRWFYALASYGVILPDIERLFAAWWSIETVGRAVAAIQYISCLMYSDYENPIFSAWTPSEGGGPPCLWEFAGYLYEHRWLDPNVSYLRGTLNAARLEEVIAGAVQRLAGQKEYDQASLVQADFPLCDDTVKARCAELPGLLETAQAPGRLFEWPISP